MIVVSQHDLVSPVSEYEHEEVPRIVESQHDLVTPVSEHEHEEVPMTVSEHHHEEVHPSVLPSETEETEFVSPPTPVVSQPVKRKPGRPRLVNTAHDIPKVVVSEVGDVETEFQEETENRKQGRQKLPDRVVTKAGMAKLAADEGKVSKNVSKSGNVTYLVEDNYDNTFIVSNKMVGKKIIQVCSCSPDGVCRSFHIMAVEYFNTGICKAPSLVPSKPNMRKKSNLETSKSKRTFGKKKPDKIAFQKYVKVQCDLLDKQKNLIDEEDENDLDDEVFIFPDHVQHELDKAQKPGKMETNEEFSCKFCGHVCPTERGLKIHTTRMHKKTSKGC